MPQVVRLTVFIIIALLVGLGFLVWFFYAPVKRLLWRHNEARMFYSHVMKTARDGDFYLLNNLKLSVGNDSILINHVLGGDKFLYVITECYYEGALSVKPTEHTWIHYQQNGTKEKIASPFDANHFAMERLSTISGISSSFMVGVVLINDDCFLNTFAPGESEILLVPVSRLEKIVMAYEKRDVKPFVKKELWQAIHDLHEMSGKTNGKVTPRA